MKEKQTQNIPQKEGKPIKLYLSDKLQLEETNCHMQSFPYTEANKSKRGSTLNYNKKWTEKENKTALQFPSVPDHYWTKMATSTFVFLWQMQRLQVIGSTHSQTFVASCQ